VSAGLPVGEVLLSRAADLIVMGAYGHSRVREMLLGGTTRSVLRSMTVPVLLSHRPNGSSTGPLAAEGVIEDRPLLRCQRLVERLDGRFCRLQCIEPRRQELLHPVEPVEGGHFRSRFQG